MGCAGAPSREESNRNSFVQVEPARGQRLPRLRYTRTNLVAIFTSSARKVTMYSSPRMTYCRLLSVLCVCAALSACSKKSESIHPQPTVEESKPLASVVRTNDPAVSSQLLSGFSAIEGGSWRWAAPHFAVAFGVPPGAAKNGGTISLAFTLPDISIKTLKTLTVSGQVGDFALTPEAYSTAGAQVYSRDLPASVFNSDLLQAQFTVDKFLQPDGDKRQLSLVVTSIQLQSK